jgi:hypothetical protein
LLQKFKAHPINKILVPRAREIRERLEINSLAYERRGTRVGPYPITPNAGIEPSY